MMKIFSNIKNKINNKNFSKNIFIVSGLFYTLLLFCVFYLGSAIGSFVLAFQKIDIYGNANFYGFRNFIEFFEKLAQDGAYLSVSFKNSLKMYIINFCICMPLYILFAYMIFKKCFGHIAIRAIAMIPRIISGLVIALVFKKFVDFAFPSVYKSITGNYAPSLFFDARYSFGTTIFYMIWVSFSGSLIVYPNAMNKINDSVIESAQLDGANMFQELWYIVLPLIFPTLSTAIIVGFSQIFSTSGPLLEFYYLNPPLEVYNVGYYYFNIVKTAPNNTVYPLLAAGGLVMTIVIAPLTHLLRHMLEKFGPSAE